MNQDHAPHDEQIGADAIILLDLNYTLVSNSVEGRRKHNGAFWTRLAEEEYRGWLIDRLRGASMVLLVTARPASAKNATLRRIQQVTGWQPHNSYFNTHGESPPASKRRALLTEIFPSLGSPAAGGASRYLAIESNRQTVAMYHGQGIRCVKAVEDERGQRLDRWPEDKGLWEGGAL